MVRSLNKLLYEISPHPSWLRKKTEIVSIDRLKTFHSHPDDNLDEYSVPPPKGLDLSMPGDEYGQHFQIPGAEEEDNDETHSPSIPIQAPLTQDPLPPAPELPQPQLPAPNGNLGQGPILDPPLSRVSHVWPGPVSITE